MSRLMLLGWTKSAAAASIWELRTESMIGKFKRSRAHGAPKLTQAFTLGFSVRAKVTFFKNGRSIQKLDFDRSDTYA